ncbi:PEP-CTERM sorting domain-containing protein [Desulfuromonas acetoxidans]|uniref:PEP-CTERM sorting domain-containing protein n=1 Tax=Desulfuromonas acetoxidans TaxID=891 RepID=UPI0009D77226|nr:PEP-CTERM sorting domain-containing protein [Desulfuromonas acetoxidans]MBF0644489.1 PEP-CTERM sorting domain-containing protein [Desulfuromonas acetoxidans]NVD24657.1 PEP-CTERM sorting domain-containing protein [Desulfuromonas acetoxidans]NVE16702.1 PEP-CTERM sorting domain-containing protein [Desulfuromonas acetoxidans]
MRKIVLLPFAVIIFSLPSMAFGLAMNLQNWTASPGGNWNVSNDGYSVLQTINGQPTYFVSDTDYFNRLIEGTLTVKTTSDDDFIGFVFGLNSSDDYLLFDWKQNNQTAGPGTGLEGFTLSRITGSDINLWEHTGNDLEILASSYSSSLGWRDLQNYEFSLDYSAARTIISIDDETIFDIAGDFNTGLFGFYNYSQAYVNYSGFVEEQSAVVPEPSTFAFMCLGVIGVVALRKKQQRFTA